MTSAAGARRDEIAAGLADVRARIDAARRATGRVDDVRLLVVTKTFPATDLLVLADLGVTDVGENRDQEARAKRTDVGRVPLRWHMIGQVQRNKAASVVRWADVVESVDRPELAAALGRAAIAAGRRLEILLQIDLDPVPTPGRGGVDPAGLPALLDEVARQPGLDLRGVMGVAPNPSSGLDPRAAFARLRGLSETVRSAAPGADRISAGMSGDLEAAVAEGATQVRIGGAVLGHRTGVQ